MGWRFRKSISLGRGVRLNVSKKGIGLSVGVRGARVSVGPSGSRTTLGIPGTGVYYEQRLGSGRRARDAKSGAAGCITVIVVAIAATVLPVAVVSWIR